MAGGDGESQLRGPEVTFLNRNMHNSVAGELFLETEDQQLRLFLRGLGQLTIR